MQERALSPGRLGPETCNMTMVDPFHTISLRLLASRMRRGSQVLSPGMTFRRTTPATAIVRPSLDHPHTPGRWIDRSAQLRIPQVIIAQRCTHTRMPADDPSQLFAQQRLPDLSISGSPRLAVAVALGGTTVHISGESRKRRANIQSLRRIDLLSCCINYLPFLSIHCFCTIGSFSSHLVAVWRLPGGYSTVH